MPTVSKKKHQGCWWELNWAFANTMLKYLAIRDFTRMIANIFLELFIEFVYTNISSKDKQFGSILFWLIILVITPKNFWNKLIIILIKIVFDLTLWEKSISFCHRKILAYFGNRLFKFLYSPPKSCIDFN